MSLVNKLKDGLKVAFGRKLSQRQMRTAKKVGYLDVIDNPGTVVDVGGYFMKYEEIALRETRADDGSPLIKTVTNSYNSNGLLYHTETIVETNGRWKSQETFYLPAGSFIGVSGIW